MIDPVTQKISIETVRLIYGLKKWTSLPSPILTPWRGTEPSHHPRGRLRISVPLLFTEAVLGKLAADFALAHPEVRLEVTAEDRAVDMVEEGYDLVVRVNPRPEADLMGRCFVRDRYIVVASSTVQRPRRDETVPAVLLARDNPTATWAIREGRRARRSRLTQSCGCHPW
jgi:DNA-binding transcriptional LysR family regulator